MCSNFCSMCGGTAGAINYVKKVDPPIQPYGTILGNEPSERSGRRHSGGQMPCIHMCLPTSAGNSPQNSGGPCPNSSAIQIPNDCPPQPPTKIWLIKSSPTPQKSACLPVTDSCPTCPSPPAKLLVCLPCPPPAFVFPQTQNSNQGSSIPFGVPQLLENGNQQTRATGGKYLPPPQKRICGPNCIHVSDIRGEKPCTWYDQIPCVAHCFETPLRKN